MRLRSLVVGSFMVLACGPQAGAPADGVDGMGEGQSSGSNPASTTGEPATGGSLQPEDGSGATLEPSGSSSSGEPVPCEAAGGEDLDLGRLSLDFTGEDPDPFAMFAEPRACTVLDVTEPSEGIWAAQLDCSDPGLELTLEWQLADSYGLVDRSWAGRSLTFAGEQTVLAPFAWWTLHNNMGELVAAEGTASPPDELTAPFTIGHVDLGETCPVLADTCSEVFDHVLTFTSEDDATLACYDGRGHITDRYVVAGSYQRWELPPALDECMEYDAVPVRMHFAIVRRPSA